MGKLKKDISSSVYLQFVNKIWKKHFYLLYLHYKKW